MGNRQLKLTIALLLVTLNTVLAQDVFYGEDYNIVRPVSSFVGDSDDIVRDIGLEQIKRISFFVEQKTVISDSIVKQINYFNDKNILTVVDTVGKCHFTGIEYLITPNENLSRQLLFNDIVTYLNKSLDFSKREYISRHLLFYDVRGHLYMHNTSFKQFQVFVDEMNEFLMDFESHNKVYRTVFFEFYIDKYKELQIKEYGLLTEYTCPR